MATVVNFIAKHSQTLETRKDTIDKAYKNIRIDHKEKFLRSGWTRTFLLFFVTLSDWTN